MKTTEIQIEKPTDAQIDRDVDALKDDVSNLRDDFAALLRSLQYRARNVAADSRNKAKKWTGKLRSKPAEKEAAEVYVQERQLEPDAESRKLVIKRPGMSGRTLLLFFTLGMAAALLATQKREAVIVERRPRRGLGSRLMTKLPWIGKARRRADRQATERASDGRLVRSDDGRVIVAQEPWRETQRRFR